MGEECQMREQEIRRGKIKRENNWKGRMVYQKDIGMGPLNNNKEGPGRKRGKRKRGE